MPSEAVSSDCLICLSDGSSVKTIPRNRTVMYAGMSSMETHLPSAFFDNETLLRQPDRPAKSAKICAEPRWPFVGWNSGNYAISSMS
jgi:hypothetical protein